jgi:hypothetical protein
MWPESFFFQALPAVGKLGTLIRRAGRGVLANMQFYNLSKKQRTGCRGIINRLDL